MKNTALITGSSSGIGMEFARYHAAQKGDLVLAARGEKELTQLKAELEKQHGVKVRIFPVDLTEPGVLQDIFDTLQREGIDIDILINNAGFGDFGPFHTANWAKANTMIQLNITALTQLTHLFLPGMVKRRHGKILNVASTAAFFPGPLMAVYYATKHFVLSFSEGISEELKGTGVTVTALCPGPTASGFQAAADLGESKLVKGKKLPTSKEVAIYGYTSMKAGKVVAIHGLPNKFQAFLVRFLPRSVARSMVKGAQAAAK
jgi:uncharacterized protein